MGTVLSGNTEFIYLLQDTKGRTYVKGLWDTRRKLMEMGMERNYFENIIKESAKIVASRATRYAPVETGTLALGIRAFASKKYTIHGVEKRAYGGVVVAKGDYARRISYGFHSVAGTKSKAGNRVWRTTTRSKPNPYMVRAREDAKPGVVKYWNYRIDRWIKQKGFGTNGI
jgi:hypothetical protein